jgi:hypothetical protein
VASIRVIADGESAFDSLSKLSFDHRVSVLQSEERYGIHRMWNIGLSSATPGSHVLFMNDDVAVDGRCIDVMSSLLDRDRTIGLMSPNYDKRYFSSALLDVAHTCRGAYDGTGGIGGFCMMLSSELVRPWRFDESMKWWYGDDDLLMWVTRICSKRAVLTGLATCSTNTSWTINNDPPDNFAQIVENDRMIFTRKWGG